MLYKGIVGPASYQVINLGLLSNEPGMEDIMYQLEMSNDTARIINPDYYPEIKKWLIDHGHDGNCCYIGWASW